MKIITVKKCNIKENLLKKFWHYEIYAKAYTYKIRA